MAESPRGKSRGLQFAERQLLRHGWEHGKGLGRDENGISEALKVKVKCDKGGVGHKEGDQFTFHWWDHVFNKTSASLEVQSDHSGTTLRKNNADNSEGTISNKKPRKANLVKDKLYGAFVKSATLVSGQERAVDGASTSDDSSSDEDETKLDLSSTTKLSDAQLVKACGGRTAHKGARHGLSMSAKLARLEQQEAEFMAKYGKKAQPEKDSGVTAASEENTTSKKKKKKKKSKDSEVVEPEAENGHREEVIKRKKKKKKDGVEEVIQVESNDRLEGQEDQEMQPPKKKKKKKKSKD